MVVNFGNLFFGWTRSSAWNQNLVLHTIGQTLDSRIQGVLGHVLFGGCRVLIRFHFKFFCPSFHDHLLKRAHHGLDFFAGHSVLFTFGCQIHSFVHFLQCQITTLILQSLHNLIARNIALLIGTLDSGFHSFVEHLFVEILPLLHEVLHQVVAHEVADFFDQRPFVHFFLNNNGWFEFASASGRFASSRLVLSS